MDSGKTALPETSPFVDRDPFLQVATSFQVRIQVDDKSVENIQCFDNI